jgi:hypothetical protein
MPFEMVTVEMSLKFKEEFWHSNFDSERMQFGKHSIPVWLFSTMIFSETVDDSPQIESAVLQLLKDVLAKSERRHLLM